MNKTFLIVLVVLFISMICMVANASLCDGYCSQFENRNDCFDETGCLWRSEELSLPHQLLAYIHEVYQLL
ncbi:hypothetical protein PPL_10217 [Heterostelium album PN500]|uniref:Uncharacterized protein n=1 Tax=Heterostelium pallidum (strain ATCC 26659 / Pp 5 / PN500) TaxID=670386 RepID=D3BQN2_HETP5|nr:hypothetical protein PPL_10217 [Heterostelium album PN500]EFA76452.1 hypothetical protein PPL_10217 [Heterostelium album PN500]|eukprot:XP_020428584.1 hypothetical protein PPL_10217 [Heterostelium album PN500]